MGASHLNRKSNTIVVFSKPNFPVQTEREVNCEYLLVAGEDPLK